jgi:hypothetical protein
MEQGRFESPNGRQTPTDQQRDVLCEKEEESS